MNHILQKRVILIFAVAAIAAVAGSLGGFLLARFITVKVTEGRLEQYASRTVADGEASSAELRTVLSAMNASRYRPCSADEIGYFRALIFESDYLKDAGRMSDGHIGCSAALGRVSSPSVQARPDFTQQDGTIIYKNLAPYQKNGDLTTITLQLGDSFVVFTPYTRMHLELAPMHYTETLVDAPTQKAGQLLGESPGSRVKNLTTEGLVQLGDHLYSTRCSIRYFNCVTAYTSVSEMVLTNRNKFAGFIGLFGLLGASVGVAASFLYRRNKSLEQQLRRAIAKDQLRVVYQPIVRLADRRIVGAEALVRWTDEEGSAVGPAVFVKIAEEHGFVGSITKLVLSHVIREFGSTLRDHSDFHLSINITAADLSDPQFLSLLERSLDRAAIPARSLAIEITESSTVRYVVAIDAICRLRQRGHSVHIDDFGTGYSSLSYLHDLSVDAIKIDRSFTQAIGTGSVVVAILPQILAMAEALNLRVIVEGVETEEQAVYFQAADKAILAQGWLFGRPVRAAEFQSRLVDDTKKAPVPASMARLAPSQQPASVA
jgi:sensor c-di-GMP phosphodiesterase-like protein